MDKMAKYKLLPRAVYAGSFDPITRGHLDIIRRTINEFGGCTVLVAVNPNKKPMFDSNERMELVQQSIIESGLNPYVVEVGATDRYVADFCRERIGSRAILIRGIRSSSELEYEKQIADFNLERGVDTVFFSANEKLSGVSSSGFKDLVRQRLQDPTNLSLSYDGLVKLVTPTVIRAVHKKLGQLP